MFVRRPLIVAVALLCLFASTAASALPRTIKITSPRLSDVTNRFACVTTKKARFFARYKTISRRKILLLRKITAERLVKRRDRIAAVSSTSPRVEFLNGVLGRLAQCTGLGPFSTPLPSLAPTSTGTPATTPSPGPTETVNPSESPTPTATSTSVPSPSPTDVPAHTPSATATVIASPTAPATVEPTATPTVTPSATVAATPTTPTSPEPTTTPTATASASPTATATLIPTGTPTLLPTIMPTAPVRPTVDQVTINGATFRFDREYLAGTFINGDPWVAVNPETGVVVLTELSPRAAEGRNGFQINLTTLQGFDSRLPNFNAGLQPKLPLSIEPNNSVIKAISKGSDTTCSYDRSRRCILSQLAVLTVLATPPPDGGVLTFRPPFAAGPDQKHLVSALDVQFDIIPALGPPPSGSPTFDLFIESMQHPQWEPSGNEWSGAIPERSGPNDSALRAKRNSDALLRLILDDPFAAKARLLIVYLQYGIDLYFQMLSGSTLATGDGSGNGRKLMLAFAGLMFDNELGESMRAFVRGAPPDVLSENGGAYRSDVNADVLWGYAGGEEAYWKKLATGESGNGLRDPYQLIDGGIPGGDEQHRNLEPMVGTALAVRLIPGLREIWNHEESLDLADRWVSIGSKTQPDICAPAFGVCKGGSQNGSICTTATTSQCPQGKCDFVTYWSKFYKTKYGPDGRGYCITDDSKKDGVGRFPKSDRVRNQKSTFRSQFAHTVWEKFRYEIPRAPDSPRPPSSSKECVPAPLWWKSLREGKLQLKLPCWKKKKHAEWIYRRSDDDFK